MRVEKLRKKFKFEWTENYVFGDLCFWYLERNPNKINKLEKILFLMQHESLSTHGVPLLLYKTYIYDDGIYLRYLSDMLRISEPDAIYDKLHIAEKVKQFQYEKMRKKYEKYTEKQLNDEIKRLINTNSLDKEYFVFEKYLHQKETKKIRMFSHPFLFGIMGLCIMLSFGMILSLILLLIKGIIVREYNLEEIQQAIFFGTISTYIAISCRRKAIKKPSKYESKNNFTFTTFCNEADINEEALPYNDDIDISTQVDTIDTSQIQTNIQLQNIEKRIFNDICEMIKDCAKKYPGVYYAVTLERSKQLDLESEILVQNYRSTVYVYLTRNHIILERREDEGEWPGSNSEIIKIGRTKISINDNYKEEIKEGIEWFSQVYLGDKQTHYENKEESDLFVQNASYIEWIDE
ncbi:MAG: hypothetical protein RR512_08775 [Coprobacillus sp.]